MSYERVSIACTRSDCVYDLQEGEKFQIVDQAWRDLMELVAANPGALAMGADKERLATLQENNK